MPGRHKPNQRQKSSHQKSGAAVSPPLTTAVQGGSKAYEETLLAVDDQRSQKEIAKTGSDSFDASHSFNESDSTKDSAKTATADSETPRGEQLERPAEASSEIQTELLAALDELSAQSQAFTSQSKAPEIPKLNLPQVQETVSTVVTESDVLMPSPKRRSRPIVPSGGAAAAALSLDDTFSSIFGTWSGARQTQEVKESTAASREEHDMENSTRTLASLDNTLRDWLQSAFYRERAPSEEPVEEFGTHLDNTPSAGESMHLEASTARRDSTSKLRDVEDMDVQPATSASNSRRPSLIEVEDVDVKKFFPKDGRASQGGARPAAISTWWPWPLSSSAAEPAEGSLESDKALDLEKEVSAPDDSTECPVCFEIISTGDAAMRCGGEAGVYHYCHKLCMSNWIKQCKATHSVPTCPVCRGRLQINIEKLATFLEDSTADELLESDRSLLKQLLHRARATLSETPENVWADPFTKEDVGFAGTIGLAVSAGFLAGCSDEVLDDVALLAANELTSSSAVSLASSVGYIAGVTTNVASVLV